MTYLDKFKRLKALLYANYLAFDKSAASQQAFQAHYEALPKDDSLRLFMGRAAELTIEVNDLTEQLAQKEISDRFAYLSLLTLFAGREFIPTGRISSQGEEKTKRDFTAHVANELLPKAGFVEPEEAQFAFLCANAKVLMLDVLDAILHELDTGSATILETNWLIALEVYQRYTQIKTKHINPQKEKMEGVLLGYLANKTTNVFDVMELTKKVAPFSVSDYLFYQMTRYAVEQGPNPSAFFQDMQQLLKKHKGFGAAYSAREVGEVGLNAQPSVDFDKEITAKIHPFVMEVNKLYQGLKREEKAFLIEEFVKNINQLDQATKDMQEKLALFNSLKGSERPDERIQQLKLAIEKDHQALKSLIILTREQAKQLLYQGKPSNTLLKILGIGLLVLGVAAIAASVALSILLPPVGVGLGAAWLTTTLLASSGSGLGGVISLGLGGVSFFKGTARKPAKVTAAANDLIDFCEQKGLEAYTPINGYQA